MSLPIQSNNSSSVLPIPAAIYEDTPPSYEEAVGQPTETTHPIEIDLFSAERSDSRKFLYEGTLLNGKPHNKGVAKEMLQAGGFMNLKFNGTFSHGSLVEGTMTSNGPNKFYIGTFKDNAFLKGELIKSDNSSYKGEFNSFSRLVNGVMIFPNREKHEGTFSTSELLTIGTVTSPSNQITRVKLDVHCLSLDRSYRYHGEGTITLPNGDVHEGIFHNMILYRGTITSPNGKIKRVFSSSCTIS